MDYVFALELKTGLEWSLASKVAPISADLITVFLIGLLVDRERAANTRLLYALSPLALLITAFHGQVEPVSVALGLGALVLARQHKPGWAGVALGCAIATKTWPVLFVPGVLREIPIHRWWRCLLTAGSALMAFFLSTRIILGGGLHNAVHVITSYRSFTGAYGGAACCTSSASCQILATPGLGSTQCSQSARCCLS